MILEVDDDGSGVIEFPEFLTMMANKVTDRDPKGEIQKAFSLFTGEDPDKISFKDLRRLADDLGVPMTDEEDELMVSGCVNPADGNSKPLPAMRHQVSAWG